MRANWFQKYIIMVSLALVTIRDTFRLVYGSFFVKDKQQYCSRVVNAWACHFLRIARVKYKVFNPLSFKFNTKRPYMIMSNHASHFDIPLIYAAFPKDCVAMISKKEIFRIPVFGTGMKYSGCVSIDRENKRQAIKDLVYARDIMLKGVKLWVAPEGTRSLTGKIGVFKRGGFKVAMTTKAIIVPVTIIGSRKILPSKTMDLSLDEEVEIYIGKSIDTDNYKKEDLNKLVSDVHDEIVSKLE